MALATLTHGVPSAAKAPVLLYSFGTAEAVP